MMLGGLLAVVFAAGAVGGVANALLTENGFVLPRWSEVAGVRVLRPGFLLNVFVGGLAGAVSWGLYGPFAAAFVVGGGRGAALGPGMGDAAAGMPGITLGGLVGAVLVGVAGARWLTNESERRLLQVVAARTAASRTTVCTEAEA